jgi:hypothetical protein
VQNLETTFHKSAPAPRIKDNGTRAGVIRVKTDFLSLAFVSLAEFEIINRIATVFLREFLVPISIPAQTPTTAH